jgi:hypothetical protein
MENRQVVEIEMLRRITGYLVPHINRWSDGKRAELKDRVKHAGGTEIPAEWLGKEFITED